MKRYISAISLGLLSIASSAFAASYTVMVGAGKETTVINAFIPENLKVHVGDTVVFKLSNDELYGIALPGKTPLMQIPQVVPVPGGKPEEVMFNPAIGFPSRMPGAPVETYDGSKMVGSGFMSKQPSAPGAPPNNTLSVKFAKAGTYMVYELLHPYMTATVEVVPVSAKIPTVQQVTDQTAKQAKAYLDQVPLVMDQAKAVRSEPGPNGTTVWYVRAGAMDFITGNPKVQTYAFAPKNITIKAGDAIVWTSAEFHTVSLIPAPPYPEAVVPVMQPKGPPLLTLNPMVFAPFKPSGSYDPSQFFNSGPIGPLSDRGNGWTLTFDTPGTYKYFCSLHRSLGMEGQIIVQPRD